MGTTMVSMTDKDGKTYKVPSNQVGSFEKSGSVKTPDVPKKKISGSSVESKSNTKVNGYDVTVTKDGKTGNAGDIGVVYKTLDDARANMKGSYSYYRNSDGTVTAYEANQRSKNYRPGDTVKKFMDETGYKPYSGKYSDYLAKGGTSNDMSDMDKASIAGLQAQFKQAQTELEKQWLNQKANQIRAKYGVQGEVYKPLGEGRSTSSVGTMGGGTVATNPAENQTVNTNPAVATPIANQVDPYAEIKMKQAELLEAQKRAKIAQFEAQREQANDTLQYEKKQIAPKYLQQKTNLNVSSQQQARSFDEYLASRGLASSGSAAQGEIARNVSTQQGLTDIGTAESGAYADIARRKSAADLAYQSSVTGAENEFQSAQAQAEINALMQQQSAAESSAASQAANEFEMQKIAQKAQNDLLIEQLKLEAQAAVKAGDREHELKVLERKNQLEKENIRLTASLRPVSSGSGSGGSVPKPTEGQLNTLMNNFSIMVAGNPYYKTGGAIYRKKRLDEYLYALGTKIQAGAIDPTTATAMAQYVQQSPEYKAIYGDEPL